MGWLSYTLLGMFIGSFTAILRRIIMKDDKSDAYASVVFFQLTGFLIVLVFCLANGARLPDIAAHPANYIAQAVLWGASSYCLFKASKYLGAAEISIIATLSAIITIVTAVFFLHEVFTPTRVIGTVLIIFAVVLVSLQIGRMKVNIGIAYTLLYCLASGIAITNDTYLLRSTNIYSLLTVGWLTPGLFLILVRPNVIGKLGHFFAWDRFRKIFLMTLVYALGGIFFYLAIAVGGQASQVNTISQGGIILTTVLAAFLLKEKSHLGKKIVSAVIVVAGVILLS